VIAINCIHTVVQYMCLSTLVRVECCIQVTLLRKFCLQINGNFVLVLHILPEVYNLLSESESLES